MPEKEEFQKIVLQELKDIKNDVKDMKTEMGSMKTEIGNMKIRQDEIYQVVRSIEH